MRAYFVITHATGLTREEWQELDSLVNGEDRLRSLHSWQTADGRPLSPNRRIQLANKLEPHPTDPNLFVRSLAGLDIEPEAQRQLPGAQQSIAARLVAYLRQAIRDEVPGTEQNDYDVQLVSEDTPDDPESLGAIRGAQEWLRTENWRRLDRADVINREV